MRSDGVLLISDLLCLTFWVQAWTCQFSLSHYSDTLDSL